jgi:hypothetical protein
MAVISNLDDQTAQPAATEPPKAMPSYMRPTKTSTSRVEDVKPKSKVLRPKDTNQVQRVVSVPKLKGMKSTVRSKAGLGVKGKGKENKNVKSDALALVAKVSLSFFSYDSTDESRPPERHPK